MAVGDIYERRLRTNPELLGSGTPSSSTFLRGDGTWGSPSVDNIENTLIQMAWDVYSEDRAFDDIYADDLTDQTGIDTVNSAGTYNSGSSYYQPAVAATGTTTDYTSSQIDTTHWTDINSVAITQTTPGDATASAIYHAVSFDGGATYKKYSSVETWSGALTCSGTPPASRYGSVSVLYGTSLYVFGGTEATGTTFYNDTYKLDLTSNAWSSVTCSGSPPAGRYLFFGGISGNYLYIFGGQGVSTTLFNNVYKLDLSASPPAWSEVSCSGTTPSARRSMVGGIYDGCLFVFGGYTATGDSNAVYKLDLSSSVWSELSCSGSTPSARRNSSGGIYGNFLYVFGGNVAGSLQNDTYKLNLSTNVWSGSFCSGTPPAARQGAISAIYENYLYILGGNGATSVLNDVHKLDLTTDIWSNTIACQGTAFSIRGFSNGVVYNNFIYSSGGYNGSTVLADVNSLAIPGGWTSIARNYNSAWQYANAGAWTNSTHNSLTTATTGALAMATAQSAYQWTKANIEAMTDANWEASGGWSASVTTVDWATRAVDGTSISGSSSDYASALMTSDTAPSGVCSGDSYLGASNPYWKAFNQSVGSDCWASADSYTTHYIQYQFSSATIINKYSILSWNYGAPAAWYLKGSNDGENWSSNLDSQSYTMSVNSTWTSSQPANTTAYTYYRLTITAYEHASGNYCAINNLKFMAATTATATPTFTKSTFNHDTEHVALDLRTNGWEASVNDPTDGYVVLDVEPVDAITNNTDIKTYISIDNGSNYEQVTLESTPFREIGDHDYIRGDISGITARTDKTIRFKVTSHNSKNFKVHGLGGGVKY